MVQGEYEMTLVEISEDLIALDAAIDAATTDDGEITDEAGKALDAWFAVAMQNRDLKLDNYGALYTELTLRAEAREEEAKRLEFRSKVDANRAKWLKQKLFDFMELHKVAKVETRRYKFSVCSNGGVMPLDMPERVEDLPEAYQKEVTTVTADVAQLRRDLEAGAVIEGCKLLPRGKHLRIK